jgi:hypothetical protein
MWRHVEKGSQHVVRCTIYFADTLLKQALRRQTGVRLLCLSPLFVKTPLAPLVVVFHGTQTHLFHLPCPRSRRFRRVRFN